MTDERNERERAAESRSGSGPELGPELDPELEPAEEQRVRGLLADLDAPAMPDDVAHRLDDALAGLVSERRTRQPVAETAESSTDTATDTATGTGAPDQVVPLRRRWARVGAMAAAAVIVVGVGGVALNEFLQDQGTSESAAGRSAESADDGGSTALSQSPPPPSAGEPQDRAETLARALPAVRPRTFAADVTRLLGTPTALRAVPGDEERAGGQEAQSARPAGCPGPRRPGTTTLPVRYDGVLSALVVHPEKSGRRLVEVWDCGGRSRLATAQVAQQD